MPTIRAFVASTICLIALAMPPCAAAAPGDLDPSFGTGGIVTTDLGSVDRAMALALQPDGKLIAAGSKLIRYFPPEIPPLNDIAVARYNPDGSLDPTFGTGGVVTTAENGYSYEDARAVVVQPDGKILVGGASLIVRYEADGTLDATFGNGGMISGGSVTALVLQPDGKIVAASVVDDDFFDFRLTRYNGDGSLDASFGTGGIVIAPDTLGYDTAYALVVQPDGKLVAAGTSQLAFALVRYAADGSLDPSFGSGGVVTTPISGNFDGVQALVLQPSGKLVAAGFAQSHDDIALVAYESDGSLDASFGNGGIVTTTVGAHSEATALVLQPDAMLVVAGFTSSGGNDDDFVLARYAGTGSLAALCDSVPTGGCRSSTLPDKGQLSIKDQTPDGKDRLQWAWSAGAATTILDFGTPETTTPYAVCVYDETGGTPSLVMTAGIPASGLCGSKPCWKTTTHGFKFADKDGSPDGVVSLTLQAGADGKAKIKLKARGLKLPTPALPFAQDSTVTVQLRNDGGGCWDTDFTTPSIKNTGTEFRDKGQ